mmetsp:Transcript_26873/g.60099  ORF Transcript_26873/g.60099 Transcript_26873/m.60099 type:complete len:269 (+) Transcript_26873:169-975(+)
MRSVKLTYALLTGMLLFSTSTGFVTRARIGKAAVRFVLTQLNVESLSTDFGPSSKFFVDNFWAPQLSSDVAFTDKARMLLLLAQNGDFETRYGDTVGKRRLAAKLLAKRGDSGELSGLVTVEMTLISRLEKEPKSGGEKILGDAISKMGPKQRRAFKGYSTGQLVTEILPDDIDLVPMLSNLAVDLSRRRGGVGLEMCLAAEETSREWGFQDIWLQVEKVNLPAKRLYEEKLGYKVEWENEQPALRIAPDGTFTEVLVPMLTMSKSLS